jgi:hypothetical protein
LFSRRARAKPLPVIGGNTVHFDSGLQLRTNDGRVRQGDCLTDYKAQGIKGAEVRGIEDNGSAMAMANKEAFHVKGTRHVQNLTLHVENKGLYVEAIQRSNVKFSALELERGTELRVLHEAMEHFHLHTVREFLRPAALGSLWP